MSKPKVKKSHHEQKRLRTAPPPTIRASQSPDKKGPLDPEQLRKINAYWRAANYLSVGQIYLCENPLLREPLKLEHVKQLLLGHWGTTPGQNFIYAHLNRVIKQHDLNMIYISGPGHGAPAVVGNVYLEGTYSEVYPNVSQDEAGLQKLFQQFSFPGGISSHVSPQTPGSIHEGGELGYSISHAFGAAFDNPDLVVACVVGDGEAETGPLATAWHSNKFLDPVSDGVVLPILHLNGYKISNPTVLARITHEELDQLLRGYGWTPYFVEGEEPEEMHQTMAATLDKVVEQIQKIQHDARIQGDATRPRWPMIVLRSLKGLDRTESHRWSAGRGHVPGASGAALRVFIVSSRASRAARELDAKLQAGGTLRRARSTRARTGRAGAEGRPPDGRQSPRQRWETAARTPHAGLPQLRRQRPRAHRRRGRQCARAGPVPARRDQAERGSAEFPSLRSRRDDLQSAGGRL